MSAEQNDELRVDSMWRAGLASKEAIKRGQEAERAAEASSILALKKESAGHRKRKKSSGRRRRSRSSSRSTTGRPDSKGSLPGISTSRHGGNPSPLTSGSCSGSAASAILADCWKGAMAPRASSWGRSAAKESMT